MLLKVTRQVVDLLPRRLRIAWATIVVLAAVNAVAEAIGAAAILALIQLVTTPSVLRETGLLAQAFDASGYARPSQFVVAFALAVAAFYLLKNGLLLLEVYLQNRLVNAAAARTSADLLTRHVTAPHEARMRTTTAEIIRNFSVSTDTVFRTVMLALTGLVSELAIIIGIAAVLLVASPSATVVIGGVLALFLGLFYAAFRRQYSRWGRDVQDMSESALKVLQETLGSVKELVVLGRESFFLSRYASERYGLARTYARYATLVQTPRFALETLFIIAVVAVVVLASLSSSDEIGAVPQLGLYAYAGFRLLPTSNRLLTHLSNIRFGSAAVDDVQQQARALSRSAALATPIHASSLPLTSEVRLEAVTYRYPDASDASLDHISVTIRVGEVVGVVGPTGAGKSTLVDVLLGLLPPTAGVVLVDGVPLDDSRAWQQNLGYVPQTPFILNDTLASNVALGVRPADVDQTRLCRAIALAQLDAVVAELPDGKDTRLGEGGARLSGGQRQRVAIARALYPDPAVLVLDEATSALDNNTEQEIAQAIRGLRGTKTVIIIAHRVASMRGCDRLIYLERGQVVAEGSFDELSRSNEAFRRTVLPA